MSDKLRLEFDWLSLDVGSEIDRAFAASLGVAVGEEYLTRNDDLAGRTVRNQIRSCAWHLAAWLAANWWRLRWEPEIPVWWKDADWRMAHSMGSAGGGFVWPNAVFASDGGSLEIAMRPKSKSVPYEPIRYLNHVHARIDAAEFEQRIDEFMEGVLSRLDSLGVRDKRLAQLWKEILAERHDPDAYERRKLEAMAGYDPDEAPDELLKQLLEDKEQLGKRALEEVATEARHATGDALQPIRELGRSRKPKTGGFCVSLPDLDKSVLAQVDGDRPWQRGNKLARLVRHAWGFAKKPMKNKTLADLLATKPAIFTDGATVGTQMPFGLRTDGNAACHIYFDRPTTTTRRFAASRLIGDHLYFASQERLLPATRAKTSRQKFQRAFAQEFLCPVDALLEKIQTTQPDEYDITEAADHFHVSPLMIRTTLVNKGELEREALAWRD
ncbi:MAG: hypothetical protein WCO56_28025 [Verrucomicrobiota bacterium]